MPRRTRATPRAAARTSRHLPAAINPHCQQGWPPLAIPRFHSVKRQIMIGKAIKSIKQTLLLDEPEKLTDEEFKELLEFVNQLRAENNEPPLRIEDIKQMAVPSEAHD